MIQSLTLWHILRRGWWLILVGALAAAASAYAIANASPRVYRSTARYIVSPNLDDAEDADLFRRSLDTLERPSIIATYVEVFKSQRIWVAARESLDLSPSDVLDYRLVAVSLPEANVIEIAVEGGDPARARDLVNAVGREGTALVRDLYVLYDVTLLDGPGVPGAALRPQPLRDAAVAAVLGAVAGFGLAWPYALLRGGQAARRR